jgi:hypothetical protein
MSAFVIRGISPATICAPTPPTAGPKAVKAFDVAVGILNAFEPRSLCST